MALHKLSLITILMVICTIFGTEEFMENPEDLPQVRDMDTNSPSVEIRQKRQAIEATMSDIAAVSDQRNFLITAPFPFRLERSIGIIDENLKSGLNIQSYYIIDIELTVSDIAMINYLRNLLKQTQFLSNLSDTELINVNLTTVCSPNGTGFQCKCEEQFAWSYNSCIAYTPCDDIIHSTCACISAIPSVGQYCYFNQPPDCNDTTYGAGKNGATVTVCCPANFTGSRTAVCENGNWNIQNNCVLNPIRTLALFSQNLVGLDSANISLFVANLATTITSFKRDIEVSPATTFTIVTILNNVADASGNTSISMMTDILETVSVLVSPDMNNSWTQLNGNNTDTSSLLLKSVENFTRSLSSDSVNITKPNIELSKTTFTSTFNTSFNSSQIFIPKQRLSDNKTITTIVFTTLDFVLPTKTNGNINGIVMLVYVNQTINNVSMTFDKTNKTKGSNQCVFWNFTLFNGSGGWDSTGCQLQSETNDSVTCSCNHLTSFSILMSPCTPNSSALDIITYIGVGISMGCLVLCLIIEAFVWSVVTKNSTAHMRHVAIVNIALSLLIADIWFIIGAAVSDVGQSTPKNVCSAVTFFIHFFYLALFFWMLISALLLFYRTMMVFSHISKRTMMAISFTVGYGAPLIIATITIAVTARSGNYLAKEGVCLNAPENGYSRQYDICWLNWYQTKALLAFVIPALIIVFVNLLILFVILVKLLMRGVGENHPAEEKNALVVIARCVTILAPFFGITWGLGIGTMMQPTNLGMQIAFAVFNSLQGFFILVFGTLIDSRIRSAIAGRFSFLPLLSTRTKSTSAGPSSSSSAGRFK
ncbi:adhesion G protein-coupled receptor F5-like isoform X2 [Brienomyrus brachyistius]|uniref:adhesion G protein-coupled receptor F5-like isoform X2 n=1 Tax=Brienomyrus brachyistius TaxID=42636 RepID=UPI0020B25DBC|nr:adhesion G protein-coupled receptor F5-like isoform X2 [Brienomyrus brachyistius]